MKWIYYPGVNLFLRTVLLPFRTLIPKKFLFPVNGSLTVDLPEGKKFIFSGNQTSPHTREMYWYGIKGFEYGTIHIFIDLVKRSKCFFDIGSNIGYYSLVARAYNPGMIIHAFEPLPAANKYLRKNASLNKFNDIVISNFALSNSNGKATFFSYKNPKFMYVEDHLRGDSSLVSSKYNKDARIEFEVNTTTLDDYVKEHLDQGTKVDLLKIDTEGSENLVFEGAVKVLTDHRPVILCEIIKDGIEREINRQLAAHRYKFYLITEQGLIYKQNIIPDKIKEDYFCVPEEKEELIRKYILPQQASSNG
jgi:FkbM family methyltransferase